MEEMLITGTPGVKEVNGERLSFVPVEMENKKYYLCLADKKDEISRKAMRLYDRQESGKYFVPDFSTDSAFMQVFDNLKEALDRGKRTGREIRSNPLEIPFRCDGDEFKPAYEMQKYISNDGEELRHGDVVNNFMTGETGVLDLKGFMNEATDGKPCFYSFDTSERKPFDKEEALCCKRVCRLYEYIEAYPKDIRESDYDYVLKVFDVQQMIYEDKGRDAFDLVRNLTDIPEENKAYEFDEKIMKTVLEDDGSPHGGTAFRGETVFDFLDSLGPDGENIHTIKELNEALRENGIRPIAVKEKTEQKHSLRRSSAQQNKGKDISDGR